MKKWFFSAFALFLPLQAMASFHLMKIVEVFPGSGAAPNAQYVVIQMYGGGQNFTNGHKIKIFDANNVEITTAANGNEIILSNVSVGTNQSKILIATPEAAALFGVTADKQMTAILPLAGGKVCFDTNIDCVSWGNYSGPATGVGTPVSPNLGLVFGQALIRRLEISGGANTLENGDDTNNSLNDFRLGIPAPRNNAGQNGTVPSATCGNNTLEGIEGCDDNNTTAGDGCNAACNIEFCGDSTPNNVTEQCDDGNNSNTDTCTNACQNAACGDGFVQPGETCDDGNTNNNDGCSSVCIIEVVASCGDNTIQAANGEECDDGNTNNNDGCSSICRNEVCGDGILQNDPARPEGCDDGNTNNDDGCSAGCVVESCGDGITQANEECDDANNQNNDFCTNICTFGQCGDGILIDVNNNGVIDVIDGDEGCDDGGEVDNDGCSAGCVVESCGDGTVQADPNRPEACDDGNTSDADACTNACQNAACGDGFVQTGIEECDDANTTDGDGCESDCSLPLPPPDDDGGLFNCTVNAASSGAPAAAFLLFALFGLSLIIRRRR